MIFVIIILFVIGIGIFIGSLFLKNEDEEEYNESSNEYLEQMLEERINLVEHRIGDVAEKSATSAQRQAKQELERLSREKMSQVNEYSDQVMDQINKNHSEVMFLYGLLSDKQKELDETVESLNRAQKELQISQRISRQKSQNAEWNSNSNDELIEKTNYMESDKENINSDIKQVDDNLVSDNNKTKQGNGVYDKRSQIMMLAKDGKTELEIAKQLSMGVGEVRLVLELSKGV